MKSAMEQSFGTFFGGSIIINRCNTIVMAKMVCEFVDLDEREAFFQLGNKCGGVFHNGILQFDNPSISGEVFKMEPENGLWIRKWNLTLSEKMVLRKLPATETAEKKFRLVYLPNPAIFILKKEGRRVSIPGNRNNLCFGDDVSLDFSVLPKQSFYILDLAFTSSWIQEQFTEADPAFKTQLDQFLHSGEKKMFLEPCSAEEYRILREFELSITAEKNIDILFLRSRIYKMVMCFFSKLFHPNAVATAQHIIHYHQVMEAEKLLLSDWKRLQSMESIARQVNLSVSSLLRQFHMVFGRSMEEYYILRKMERARNLLLQRKLSIKEIASELGYRRASAFIETFTRQYGYPPGALRNWRNDRKKFSS